MTSKSVTTIDGIRYFLGDLLGHGGQGKVFAVRGHPYAVKLLHHRSDQARQALEDRLKRILRLPLEDVAVARPLERLRRPQVGYVMELFTGMVSLQHLMRPPKEIESVTRWYLDGGGLRRRLELLAKIADIFALLHGRGLTYSDPSPQNLFVSANVDDHEVRLIDTDNVRVSTDSSVAFYTPGYGAPEILKGKLSNSLSDAHAFAVIAFETLALIHPLKGGDWVENGPPEIEEQALRGELPWIDDPEDDRNRSSIGIPRQQVLSPNLRNNFQQVFGPGLQNPLARPGLSRWSEHFYRAADNTVRCPACRGTYYVSQKQITCPWCNASRPTLVRAICILWDPERLIFSDHGMTQIESAGHALDLASKAQIIDSMVLSEGEPMIVTDRFTQGINRGEPQLRLEFAKDSVEVSVLKAGAWMLRTKNGRGDRRLTSQQKIPLQDAENDWRLHTNMPDRLHRVIQFRLMVGASR